MNKSYVAVGVILALILAVMGYQSISSKTMESKDDAMSGVALPKSDTEKDMKGDMSSTSGAMKEEGMMGVGVVLSSGKIMLEDGGKMTPIVGDYAFKTGIKVMANGKVVKTDGTSFMLKEGQSVWQDGSVMDEKMMDKSAIPSNGETMMPEKSTQSGETMMKPAVATKTETMMKTEVVMAKAGSYIPYDASKLAMANTGHVVLFFHASWCPTCRNLDTDIKANLSAIPANLTILDVDYDAAVELKKKYGVTYQHTFVQVDANGTQLKKWSGSPTLDALVGEVK